MHVTHPVRPPLHPSVLHEIVVVWRKGEREEAGPKEREAQRGGQQASKQSIKRGVSLVWSDQQW